MATPDQAALALVQAYCSWHVGPSKADTLTLDGSGSSTMVLPSLHVTALTSLTVDGVSVDADTYDWSESGILRLRCGWFGTRFRSVVIELIHGFDYLPDDVQAVIDRISARATDDVGALARVGQVQYAVGSIGVGVGGALSDFDKAALAPYRLPSRP